MPESYTQQRQRTQMAHLLANGEGTGDHGLGRNDGCQGCQNYHGPVPASAAEVEGPVGMGETAGPREAPCGAPKREQKPAAGKCAAAVAACSSSNRQQQQHLHGVGQGRPVGGGRCAGIVGDHGGLSQVGQNEGGVHHRPKPNLHAARQSCKAPGNGAWQPCQALS